jgi:hypothetical protein
MTDTKTQRPVPKQVAAASDTKTLVNTYWAAGLQAIPIRTDSTKAPALPAWKPYHDPALRVQISEFDGRGVGIVCGRASGGLEVIDFDEPSLHASWCELVEEQSPGIIQRLTIVQTPRQNEAGEYGRHVYYRCEKPEGNQKLAHCEQVGQEEPKASIETRGQGGYVLAPGCPPSCHPSGRCYELVAGDLSDIPTLTMDEREVLFACARSLTRWVKTADHGEADVHVNGHAPGESPGDQFAAATSWVDILTPHGWTAVGTDYWRRPGKDVGWSASTRSVSKSGNELFRVFSTDASPFRTDSYTKFAAYTLLNHGGDYIVAAKELVRLGFGGRKENASHDAAGDKQPDRPRIYTPEIITSAELNAAVYEQRFLVDGILAEQQSTVIGGRSKAMKTSVAIDLAISLGTGTPFLGKFETIPSSVLVLSGESGKRSIQETARAVCNARGVHLADARVSWGFKLPSICRQTDMAQLAKVVMGECENHPDRINVVVIDPAYLCLLDTSTKGLQASNLFDMGPILLGLSEWGEKTRTTVILCHHCRKGGNAANQWAPPEREDLSMAGFHEWARQWLLLGRRSAYEQGSGHHDLWLEVGGSAGHGALLGVDIDEGAFATRAAKQWDVSVMSHREVKEQSKRSTEDQRLKKREEIYYQHEVAVIKALRQCRDGETKSVLKALSGVQTGPLSEVLLNLVQNQKVEQTTIKKHTKFYDAYKPTALLLG